ncbi:MAG: methyltransferase [Ruminococcus sp.]|nr:methyltransferase [Ruminococcus sp.]
MAKGERIEPLGNGIKIIVNDMYHFSTDTILLADFAAPQKGIKAADLGAGCGTIPLLWTRNDRALDITAVEIQRDACALFERSLELNELCNIKIINADLKELAGVIPFGCFDLVSCNPPYKLGGSGLKNPDDKKLIARHEESCTVDDVCRAAKNILQFGGRFVMCQRPERLTDVLTSMRKNDLEPKRIRFVQQREGKAPKLFLVEGRRGGRSGGLVTLPTLYIESDEMISIYGSYKEDYLE